MKETINLRYLKAGTITVAPKDVPSLKQMTKEEIGLWADNYLSQRDDSEIFEGIQDFKKPDHNGYVFDEITAEAVQNPEHFDTSKENELYATPLWYFYSDPEYADNTVYENRQMGEYLHTLGFTQDHVTSIACGSSNSVSKLDKLKILDSAYSEALKDFRQDYGSKMITKIKDDSNAPQLLKELIEECNIEYLGFEKVTTSADYMPDHCVYIYMSGDILIGIQTEDKSGSWNDAGYEYGDQEIIEEIHFCDVINDNELITRKVMMKEGVESYRYLMSLLEESESKDRETFRDFLLEGDD